MTKLTPTFTALIAFQMAMLPSQVLAKGIELKEVASFPDQQVTGIAVSKDSGRIFVNFPYWSPAHSVSVAEWKDGKLAPYPSAAWNTSEGEAARHFVCVQSVVTDDRDNLWILDTGSPLQQGVIAGGAKLVQVDLKTNEVVKTYPFSDEVAPKKSYLNDVRIDPSGSHAYLTESGIGSLITVDLISGKMRRLLANDPSTKAEVGKEIVVDGIKPIDPDTQGTPQFHADGIALDAAEGWLYYHALAGDSLYKIRTADLLDEKLSPAELGKKVVKVGSTASPDGMIADAKGRIYLAAFEKDAIIRVDPETGKQTTLIEDKRLQWPDTMSWGPNGDLYVTTSQIHRTAKYNHGEDKRKEPYHVFRLTGLDL